MCEIHYRPQSKAVWTGVHSRIVERVQLIGVNEIDTSAWVGYSYIDSILQ